MTKILIIGGGASGLMAAVAAARMGADVTVLEHQPACGKKILATGNGRCNLTNTHVYPGAYRSRTPGAAAQVLARFTVEDTLDLFSDLGLYTREKNGWIYPYSQQARTVLQILLAEIERLGVRVQTQVNIRKIVPDTSGRGQWRLRTDSGTYRGDAVILAAGSKASNLPGADGSGYQLAKSLGHKILPVLPALVPLVGEGDHFQQWAGVRMDARITLRLDGKDVQEERGEVQMTGYGISGIPVFQLSRYAVEGLYEKKRVGLSLDLFPSLDVQELEDLLRAKKARSPHKDWTDILRGIFPEKICPIAACSGQPHRIARKLKDWKIPVKGWQDYTYAQVCMGGVDLQEVDPCTLESRLHKGLYFAGEILDVDGACGGYNLQWAWSSGAVAGKAACRRKKRERKGSL